MDAGCTVTFDQALHPARGAGSGHAGAAQAAASADPSALLERANQVFKLGKWVQARTLYRQYLTARPGRTSWRAR